MLDNVNQYHTHGKKKKKERHACNKRRAAPSRYQAFGQSGFSSLQAFASANAWSGCPNRIQHRLLSESTAAFVGSRSIACKCNINLLFSQDPESYPITMVSQSTKNIFNIGYTTLIIKYQKATTSNQKGTFACVFLDLLAFHLRLDYFKTKFAPLNIPS